MATNPKLTSSVSLSAYRTAIASMSPAELQQEVSTYREVIRAPAYWQTLRPKERGDFFRKWEALRARTGVVQEPPVANFESAPGLSS
ncbi:hypothetical protein H4CHR_02997 [Variovorax sp. PBS-H4]|uniref:hypothetical protein n=1 Tax=Variovorax sp. PBS-H4 TaxID=434008 RepID=UPI001317FFC0|nr:hypothetical protein [Variovorax sp. PBS-H4]VTU32365.1 hypothetical protein H4CHR_02997 [Variovorax sp. PBS-H4]